MEMELWAERRMRCSCVLLVVLMVKMVMRRMGNDKPVAGIQSSIYLLPTIRLPLALRHGDLYISIANIISKEHQPATTSHLVQAPCPSSHP